MLPHTVDTIDAVVEKMTPPFLAEPVYDGVRAQLHVSNDRWHIYTRGLEECNHLFPEIADVAKHLDGDWIFDGAVVAYSDRLLPFSGLQQRLGRLQIPMTLLLDVPVVYFAFDVLRAEGQDLIDSPLRDRRAYLEDLPVDIPPLRAMPSTIITDARQIEVTYEKAMRDGGAGAIFKDLDSRYRPGSRGQGWIRLKIPMASIQVVITAARYGRGKRAGLLSDLTVAVRGPDAFLDIGKVNSGLTDAEIHDITGQLKTITTSRREAEHVVEPKIVLEVAFGGVQESARYDSGFALRYPRIVRICPDSPPDATDSIDRVAELFSEQPEPEPGS
jgi:DNA ligase-1